MHYAGSGALMMAYGDPGPRCHLPDRFQYLIFLPANILRRSCVFEAFGQSGISETRVRQDLVIDSGRLIEKILFRLQASQISSSISGPGTKCREACDRPP